MHTLSYWSRLDRSLLYVVVSDSVISLASASSPFHCFRFYTFEIGHVSAPRSMAGLISLFVSQLCCIRCFLVHPPARNSTLVLHEWYFSPMAICHRVTRQVRPRHSPFVVSSVLALFMLVPLSTRRVVTSCLRYLCKPFSDQIAVYTRTVFDYSNSRLVTPWHRCDVPPQTCVRYKKNPHAIYPNSINI